MQHVIILGGNNTLGQIIARHLLTAGFKVTVFAMADNDFKISHHNYHYIKGDVFNIHSVSLAIEHHDAVISVYSSSYLWKLFYLRDGLQNIIKCMNDQNINRLIFFSYSDSDLPLVTSEASPANRFFKSVFGIDYDKKVRMMNENNLHKSSLAYTINIQDKVFLKHLHKAKAAELIKKYYFYIADEVQKQLLQEKDINPEVFLKHKDDMQFVREVI